MKNSNLHVMSFPGSENKHQHLFAQLDDLLNHRGAYQLSPCKMIPDVAPEGSITETEMIGTADVEETSAHKHTDHPPLMQWARLDHFFSNWQSVIPTIVRPYLEARVP